MGKRIGRGAALTCISITAVTLVSGCAPSQPDPAPGGATLSPDLVAYDHPEFLTNRAPVLEPDNECSTLTPQLLAKVGVRAYDTYPAAGSSAGDDTACSASAKPSIMASTARVGFKEFWNGTREAAALSSRSNTYIGVVDYTAEGGQQPFLSRRILAGKYYAVTFQSGSGACGIAVDTGSSLPLTVSSGSGDTGPQTREQVDQFCAPVVRFTTKLLAELDPNGGSRVS